MVVRRMPWRKRLACWWRGHRMNVSHVAEVNGQYWCTHETCDCGKVSNPRFPGHLFAHFSEAYLDFPTTWEDLY